MAGIKQGLVAIVLAGSSSSFAQIELQVRANDIVYDRTRNVIYASVAANSPLHASKVIAITPETGAVIDDLSLPSAPSTLALSDSCSTLLVNVHATGEVLKVQPANLTTTGSFLVGSFGGQVHTAWDIDFAPGSETRVLIAHAETDHWMNSDAVAIFDNGVMLPNQISGRDMQVEFGSTGNTLYGLTQNSDTTLITLSANQTGLTVSSERRYLMFGGPLVFSSGRVYSANGSVLDPQLFELNGSYPVTFSYGPFTIDVPNDVATFAMRGTNHPQITLRTFSASRYFALDSLRIVSPYEATGLVRWGHSGYAMSTNGPVMYLLKSSLAWLGMPIRPESLTIVRGNVTEGGLPQLLSSDDERVAIRPGITFSSSQSPVEIVLKATAPASAQALSFTIEDKASSSALARHIELYNFSTGTYDSYGSVACATDDTERRVEVFADGDRYVDPKSLEVRARISYKAAGPMFSYPWESQIDHVYWNFAQ